MLHHYYTHNIDNFSALIKPHASRNQKLFEVFKSDIQNNKHPIINVIEDIETFEAIDIFQEKLKSKFKTLVVLGTGGSSLGARAIAHWLGFNGNPLLNTLDFNFLATDNLDDLSFATLLRQLDFDSTHFLIISKSGNTVETNIQLQTIFQTLKKQNKTHLIAQTMTAITEVTPQKNNLVQIAEAHNIQILKHSLVIGGRYSALTMTGLLPASMMGFDYKAILSGAKSVIDELMHANSVQESKPCNGASAMIAGEENGLLTHVFAAYGDRFAELSNWIRQLWAESLGKSAKGGLFVPSINPLDQHSQLQMYYDGIDNKTYSFIECHLKNTQQTKLEFSNDTQFAYLDKKTMHDVVHASCKGTIESLRSRGRLIRTFSIDDYTPESLGALMMHFMIETIFASYLLEVNPYDQPAVEDYKTRTKEILQS
ncbi:MAG: glucose-6-phosphate isomerase [Alphaproteobacteria bacterium]|jgi:glucose-6-phosphate isomerase